MPKGVSKKGSDGFTFDVDDYHLSIPTDSSFKFDGELESELELVPAAVWRKVDRLVRIGAVVSVRHCRSVISHVMGHFISDRLCKYYLSRNWTRLKEERDLYATQQAKLESEQDLVMTPQMARADRMLGNTAIMLESYIMRVIHGREKLTLEKLGKIVTVMKDFLSADPLIQTGGPVGRNGLPRRPKAPVIEAKAVMRSIAEYNQMDGDEFVSEMEDMTQATLNKDYSDEGEREHDQPGSGGGGDEPGPDPVQPT